MNTAHVDIKRATEADLPLIVELINALAAYENYPPIEETAQQRLQEYGFGAHPRFEVHIARVNGEPAGFTFTFETFSTFTAKPTLYLEDFFVMPQFRGEGVGKALFMNCVRLAHQRGCARLDWQVLDWNQLAIGFYDKLGATRNDQWLPYRLTEADFTRLLGEE